LVLLLKTGFTREHREAMKVKVSAFEENECRHRSDAS